MSKKDCISSLPKKFIPPHSITGLPADTPILAAFSGGADSSALLYMLAEHARQSGAKVYAAHVNHMIRGEEADRDEAFCRSVAESLGIQIFVCRRDVPTYAKESGLSVETAARNVRYDFFDGIMKQHGIPLLATAHNANDNLETMLFNMIRGCGLAGMCGIPESRTCEGGTVVRPILSMSKKEILDYCRGHSISFVTDSTNTDTDYTRNLIRANIIPALESINSGAVENASRLSASLREDSLCLTGMADWFLSELREDMSVETEKILGSPPAIANRALLSMYYEASGGKNLEYTHIQSIRGLCEAAVPHSELHLPNGIDARIERGRLYFAERKERIAPPEDFSVPLCEGENVISQINAKIIIGNSQNNKNIYKNSILLYFDSAKICGSLVARNRRGGDKITVNGVNKSIKKLLCDKKIPLSVRYRLPLICDDNGVLAVPLAAMRDGVGTKERENALCVQIDLI